MRNPNITHRRVVETMSQVTFLVGLQPYQGRSITCVALPTARGLTRIPLCYSIPYGTILAEGVTHCTLLLFGGSLTLEYTMWQPS